MKFDTRVISHIPKHLLDRREIVQTAHNTLQQEKLNNTKLKVNPTFEKSSLQKIQGHEWMSDVDMTLIEPESSEELDQETQLEELIELLEGEAIYKSKEIGQAKEVPLLALDLEATGLDTTVRLNGGNIIAQTEIVGVCLATSSDKGYYLPVRHTEIDGVLNFDYTVMLEFLENVHKKFFTIYHHAEYDRELLSIHGVNMPDILYSDTMHLAINHGLRDMFRQVGLKFLSEEVLGRKMLTIEQLLGSKSHVRFDRLPAKNAWVYGCSDATNTFGLFEQFTYKTDYEPTEDNLYITSKQALLLDMQTMNHTRSMLRVGVPVDLKRAENRLRTMIRRNLILYTEIYNYLPDDIPVGSAEKVGRFIGELLFKNFETAYKDKYGTKISERFTAEILNKFAIERKVRKLKASEKIVYSCTDDNLGLLFDKITDTKWVTPKDSETLYCIADMLSEYRSTEHEISIMTRLVRFAINDDMNITRVTAGLKMSGTGTGRFSNKGSSVGAKGSLNRILISSTPTGKSKSKYKQGDGVVGFNVQGIPSTPRIMQTARKLKKLPETLQKSKIELDKEVEAHLQDLLLDI
ncbi:DNA polymerase I family protein with 3'-5'-exonuclease and polymerase domains [Thiovulum sp. ES]|nr:DNA polymerase I family protein with 3'-5'-exonuclease and polymerase domains [Thiovulum sp. ES]